MFYEFLISILTRILHVRFSIGGSDADWAALESESKKQAPGSVAIKHDARKPKSNQEARARDKAQTAKERADKQAHNKRARAQAHGGGGGGSANGKHSGGSAKKAKH